MALFCEVGSEGSSPYHMLPSFLTLFKFSWTSGPLQHRHMEIPSFRKQRERMGHHPDLWISEVHLQ